VPVEFLTDEQAEAYGRFVEEPTPSLASIYRALTEHEKRQAYPEAIAQAHADFAELRTDDAPKQACR
jgi:hypothetical protein